MHGFVAFNLPPLLTKKVTASFAFSINRYNGFYFDSLNTNELIQRIEQIIAAGKNI